MNLLADKLLYPEFASDHCPSAEAAQAMLRWLDDDKAFARTCRELLALRERAAQPGACGRAARRIVEMMEERRALVA